MSITYDNLENKVKQRLLVDERSNGDRIAFLRTYTYDECGDLENTYDTDLEGIDYLVQGTITQDYKKLDFVDSLKEDDRLKIDVLGSISIVDKAVVFMNQETLQDGINQTGEVLEMQTTSINTNPTFIDVTSVVGEYLFLKSGIFEIELQVTADTADNGRRTSKTTLQVFDGSSWIDHPNAPSCYGYHRNNASGENTTSSKVIVNANSNQRYRYQIRCLNNGLIKTVPSGTCLIIKQIQ